MRICKTLESVRKTDNGYLAQLDGAYMQIYFLTETIVRLRVVFTDDKKDMNKPEASYILQNICWEDRLSDFISGDRKKITPAETKLFNVNDGSVIESSGCKLALYSEPFCIRLYDSDDEIIYESASGNPFTLDANNRITHYFRMKEEDCFYGFGEKTGPINKNKSFIRERATDCYSYDPARCDTMYKHMPFYIRLDRDSKKAAGFFYNNFYEAEFNMGLEKSNYFPRYGYYRADGGDMDLFILTGPTMEKILDDYSFLTGRPALLPKRALGYQGSSMYYSELPKECDKALTGFAETVRKKSFPIDGFHLSSGYTTGEDGKRYVFNWNKERFMDPSAYFGRMHALGAPNVPNVKPGVLLTHPNFDDFKSEGVFVKDSENTNEPATGAWWGGPGAMWDFTSKKAREIWKEQLKESLIKKGAVSIWNDNCEYDGLLDMDAVCDYDGEGGRIAGLKSLMATIMSKCAEDAVKEQNPKVRPYVVCRSGSCGIQKYAQNWIGDNYSSWETLKENIPTLLGVGLSGQPNTGADIGGFAGPAPEEELFVRWVQNGIFQPRFSIHSASSDNTVTEPWMYSESSELIRQAMLLRYRMLPHLYSLEALAHRTGAPIMRPLVYEFPRDERTYDESYEFLIGRDLLVANVLEKGAKEISVYLPAGTKWYEVENKYACHEGGQTITVPVNIASVPRFLREGAILPMAMDQPMNMERDKVKELSLTVIPFSGKEEKISTYTYYDDDGKTNDYLEGNYKEIEITMKSTESFVTLDFKEEGSYKDFVEKVEITMIYKEKAPLFVSLGNLKMKHFLDRDAFEQEENGWYYSQSLRAVSIKYPNPKRDINLKVSFEEFDLIGM